MFRRRYKYLIWFIVLGLVIACVPTLSTAPAVPTLDPNAINQIIAETAGAASTQTAAALPTSTSTETSTPIPRGTNTPEPTATETLILVYNSPTPFVIPQISNTIGPTTNKDFLCQVLSSPKDKEIYNPRVEFKVRWRLKNIGRKAWDGNVIDFIYDFGDRFHKTSSYNLGKNIEFGDVAEFFVDMQAPKDPGTYTTNWALKAVDFKFCKVTLTIVVKE